MSQRRRDDVSVEIPLRNVNRQIVRNDSNNYHPDDYWKEVFERYDHDNSGSISISELKAIINSREYKHDIPDWVADRIMVMADRDNNGHLDYEEFLYMVHHPDLKHIFGHLVQRYIKMIIPPRGRTDDTTDGPYEDAYSCIPPPICLVVISIVEIALFIADGVQSQSAGFQSLADGPVAAALIFNPKRRYEAWRFLTYMFVHVGYMHLIVNLLVQVILGIPLEMVHKWWRVLIVYSAGVIAGSLATSVTDPRVYLAGASGGVYALIAAHISTIILNWSEMEYAIIQLVVFLLIAGIDLGTAIYERFYLLQEKNIGYVAHLAGAFAGLMVGIGVLKNLKVRSWEKYLWWVAVCLFFVFILVCTFINIFLTSHFPTQDWK